VSGDEGLAQAGDLSAREAEILAMVADGLSNREIAQRFWVTETTIKFHLSRIYRKLEVQNRTAAAMWLRDHPAEPQETRD
jgi:DNA-binding CsgD family transcriptional regulator